MTERETDLELDAKRRLGMVLRGKYTLERLLGVGGMAVVYKATHRNQAEFAVKMLHPQLSLREDVRTRFLREGYAANSLKHPGAVLVVDDDVADDGAAFLVMELLDGVEVEKHAKSRGGRLPALEAAAIVHQLLDVLTAAHVKGVVHRDIKPANLFLTRDGTVKVLDFGIARARDAAASGVNATGSGFLMGTPAFMPPEQALAQSSLIDGQTDVWAAGATLFTLVSGAYVHEGENAQMLMVRAATTPARSLASIAPDVPEAIVAVVTRALAFDKADRWPTAAAMREALEEACVASYGQIPTKPLLGAAVAATEPGRTSLALGATTPAYDTPAVVARDAPREAATPPERPPVSSQPASPAPLHVPGGSTVQPVSGDPVAIPVHAPPWVAIGAILVGVGMTGAVYAMNHTTGRVAGADSAVSSVASASLTLAASSPQTTTATMSIPSSASTSQQTPLTIPARRAPDSHSPKAAPHSAPSSPPAAPDPTPRPVPPPSPPPARPANALDLPFQ